MNYLIKLLKYSNAGVQENWIVDPDKNRVLVYTFADTENSNIAEYTFANKIPVYVYPGFSINFSKLNI